MSNVYYNPEQCGLKIIDTLDESGLSYEFNTLTIFEAIQNGKIYWAQSSGCSCPTPFEEYHFSDENDHNLNEVNEQTLDSFINTVKTFPASVDERNSAIRKVKYRLKK